MKRPDDFLNIAKSTSCMETINRANMQRSGVVWLLQLCCIAILLLGTPMVYAGFDGDGIPDAVDLDDDNDGILDTDEMECNGTSEYDFASMATSSNQTIAQLESIINNSTSNIHGSTMTLQVTEYGTGQVDYLQIQDNHHTNVYGVYGRDLTDPTYADAVEYEYAFDKALRDFSFKVLDIDDGDAVEIIGYFQGAEVPYAHTLYPTTIITYQGGNRFTSPANNDSGTNEDKGTIDIDFSGYLVDKIVIKHWDIDPHGTFTMTTFSAPCADKDTDGDSTPDRIDSDSDNDGCPDALEGGDSHPYSDIDASDRLTASVDGDGIPGGTSQTIGTSQDNTQQAAICDPCNSGNPAFTDNDGDNVADLCDLDDDNDGILDADEGCISDISNPNQEFEYNNNHVYTAVANDDGTATSQTNWGTDVNTGDYTINTKTDWSYTATKINGTAYTFNNSDLTISVISDHEAPDGGTHASTFSDQFASGSSGNPGDFLGIRPGENGDYDTSNGIDPDGDFTVKVVLDFTVPTHGAAFELNDMFDQGTSGSDDSDTQLEIFIDGNRVLYSDMEEPFANGASGTKTLHGEDGTNLTYTMGQAREFAFGVYNNYGISNITILYSVDGPPATIGNSESWAFDNLSYLTRDCLDTDGDGIPNSLDTDSDNDGCVDAIEGAYTFTQSDLDANDRLTGGVDGDGVPTVTGSPQAIGSSQDAAVNNCGDCSVVKTLTTPAPYVVGDTVTYSIVVTCQNGDAADITINDLTSGVTGMAISAGSGSNEDSGDCGNGDATFPCTITDMANGETVTLTVTGTVQ